MVIDTFMWHNEIDVLELRLTMLDGLVDTFVAVESDLTHSGIRKGHHLGDHRNRLHPWWDKIVWVRHQGIAGEPPWIAENRQRRACQSAAAALTPEPDDIVVVSDVDEIWTESCLERWRDSVLVAHQNFRLFSLYFKWGAPWPGSIGGPWAQMSGRDWQHLRDQRFGLPWVEGGWHFSWMGEDEALLAKRDAFAHREFAESDVVAAAREGRWLDGSLLLQDKRGLPEGIEELVPASWLKVRDGMMFTAGG